MISHIDIKDFAVIKDLSLDLYPGLNIITGETGAGKSVVIEAVSMALGSRADSDYIRHGCEKAVISMLIDTDDNQYVLKREIWPKKSVCRVNGEMVSLSELSALCRGLADIHGQYDHQSLLNPENHIHVLDSCAGSSVSEVRAMVEKSYGEYSAVSAQLSSLKKQLADSERQRDFLKFEADEIRKANPKKDEDTELEASIRLMENSENIYRALSEAHSEIFSGDACAMDRLGNAVSELKNIEGISAEIDGLIETINNAYYSLEDVNSELRRQREHISFSQEELDESIDRLELLNKLKKKYGGSLEAVLSYADEAEEKISHIDNAGEELASLERRLSLKKQEYDLAAGRLSTLRKSAANELASKVNKELAELNFSSAKFDVNFTNAAPSALGIDGVEFLISANKGEDLKPLAKVASGGELSRIMLAMKRITGDADGIPTMIFDEIDTGISGASAGVVGNKLVSIAKNHQIICITHLPQIAARGEHHFRIQKSSDETSTITTVVPLEGEARVEELARLLSGTHITDSARAQAVELLKQNE